MLELTGKLLIFLGCTGIGLTMAGNSRRHYRELSLTADFVRALVSHLSFSMKQSGELARELAAQSNFSQLPYLRGFCRMQEGAFPEAWKRAVETSPGELDRQEINAVIHIGEILGAYDADTQVTELERLRITLQGYADEAKRKEQRDSKLYTSLGPLIGIAFMILL